MKKQLKKCTKPSWVTHCVWFVVLARYCNHSHHTIKILALNREKQFIKLTRLSSVHFKRIDIKETCPDSQVTVDMCGRCMMLQQSSKTRKISNKTEEEECKKTYCGPNQYCLCH